MFENDPTLLGDEFQAVFPIRVVDALIQPFYSPCPALIQPFYSPCPQTCPLGGGLMWALCASIK